MRYDIKNITQSIVLSSDVGLALEWCSRDTWSVVPSSFPADTYEKIHNQDNIEINFTFAQLFRKNFRMSLSNLNIYWPHQKQVCSIWASMVNKVKVFILTMTSWAIYLVESKWKSNSFCFKIGFSGQLKYVSLQMLLPKGQTLLTMKIL
jgi:hypothetical protein